MEDTTSIFSESISSVRFSISSSSSLPLPHRLSCSSSVSSSHSTPLPRRKFRKLRKTGASPSLSLSSQFSSICRRPLEEDTKKIRSRTHGSRCREVKRIRTKKEKFVELEIKAFTTDVLAVQDAGCYRLWTEHCSYLCSTLFGNNINDSVRLDVSCQLAQMMSLSSQRSALLPTLNSSNGCLSSLLDVLSRAPHCLYDFGLNSLAIENKSKYGDYECANFAVGGRTKSSRSSTLAKNNDNTGLQHQDLKEKYICRERVALALSVVMHFIISEIPSNQALRNIILKHDGALTGMARLCQFDCITFEINWESIKFSAVECTKENESANLPDETSKRDDALSMPPCDRDKDPTKTGRRSRKKKKENRLMSGYSESKAADGNNASLFSTSIPPMPTNKSPNDSVHTDNNLSDLDFLSDISSPNTNSKALARPLKRRKHINTGKLITDQKQAIQKLTDALSRIKQTESQIILDKNCNQTCCYCTKPLVKNGTGDVALRTLELLLSGTNADTDDLDNENTFGLSTGTDANNDYEEINPFLANESLRLSGALLTLATGMTWNLRAIQKVLPTCQTCLKHLRTRLNLLANILDNACCLSPENRQALCSDHVQLIQTLVNLLNTINTYNFTETKLSEPLQDIVSAILQAVTSITHENETAGMQLLETFSVQNDRSTGLKVIVVLLHKIVTSQSMTDKRTYDIVIYSLNTLANVMETTGIKGAREELTSIQILPTQSALQWLANWVVSQTSSYRDALVNGSFGQENSDEQKIQMQEERDLEKHEKESLVVAGNGFVLLSCLMKCNPSESTTVNETMVTENIRKTILGAIPTDEHGVSMGTSYIIKTLKAFLNFYHYSVGSLSVVVVTPVLKLIAALEQM